MRPTFTTLKWQANLFYSNNIARYEILCHVNIRKLSLAEMLKTTRNQLFASKELICDHLDRLIALFALETHSWLNVHTTRERKCFKGFENVQYANVNSKHLTLIG